MSTNNSLATHQLLDVKVVAIKDIARDTKRYELKSAEGGSLPDSEAGAHIGVHLPNDVVRQYSLLVPQSSPDSYSIAVKLDAESRGGSKYMIEQLQVGDSLQVEIPRNNFALVENAPHSVLFAGGIGITPIWCMLQRLRQLNLSWELYYATRSRADAALMDELQQLQSDQANTVHLHFDDEQGGFLDIAGIVKQADPASHLYCCGPTPMLESFKQASGDWPPAQVHVEYFTNAESSATDGGFTVELARSKVEIFVPEGKTILDAIRDAGIDAPSSCEEGICGSCEMRVLSGVPDHRDIILSDSEREANDTMMICCSGSKSPKLVLDY